MASIAARVTTPRMLCSQAHAWQNQARIKLVFHDNRDGGVITHD